MDYLATECKSLGITSYSRKVHTTPERFESKSAKRSSTGPCFAGVFCCCCLPCSKPSLGRGPSSKRSTAGCRDQHPRHPPRRKLCSRDRCRNATDLYQFNLCPRQSSGLRLHPFRQSQFPHPRISVGSRGKLSIRHCLCFRGERHHCDRLHTPGRRSSAL